MAQSVRKGGTFEAIIKRLFSVWDNQGWQAHDLRQLGSGRREGEKYDFLLITPTRVYGIEAKECAKEKWYTKNVSLKELNELGRLEAIGGRGYVAVFFRPIKRAALFTVDQCTSNISLTPDEGLDFEHKFIQKGD